MQIVTRKIFKILSCANAGFLFSLANSLSDDKIALKTVLYSLSFFNLIQAIKANNEDDTN